MPATEKIKEAVVATVGRKRSSSRVPSRPEQVELVRSIGERLREAREMQGYSQLKAAKMLGYENSTKLSKIETGRDSTQVPLWLLKRASQVYDVSLDYIMGTTETMVVDERRNQAARDTILLMRTAWERQHWRDLKVIGEALTRIERIEDYMRLLADQLDEAHGALSRVAELNPRRWGDMRGGSRLESAVTRAACTGRTVRTELYKLRRDANVPKGGAQTELDLY